MKVTKSKLTEFLTKIGLQGVELVEEGDETADFDASVALSTVDASRKPIISQTLETELTGKVHKEVAGKVNRALRKQIADLTGIDKATIEDLESDGALAKALEHYKTTVGTADAGKIDKIISDHKEAISNINKEWEGKYSELDNKFTRKGKLDIISKLHKEAKGLPTTANREKLAEQFLRDLEGQAVVKLTADGTDIELYELKNPEAKLLNASSNEYVKVTDRIEPYYKDLGLWSSDMRNEPPLKNGSPTPPANGSKQAPEMRTGSIGAMQAEFAAQLK